MFHRNTIQRYAWSCEKTFTTIFFMPRELTAYVRPSDADISVLHQSPARSSSPDFLSVSFGRTAGASLVDLRDLDHSCLSTYKKKENNRNLKKTLLITIQFGRL